MSAAIQVEWGRTPPDPLGLVSIGTTGRKIHLARYSFDNNEDRLTECGQPMPWHAEVMETLSGDLCKDCAKKHGITSTDGWETL